MDADYYLETINTVFQDFKLVRGTWEIKNPQGKLELVRPQDIRTTALLTVEGELDDISGSGQTEAAHKLCSGIVRQEHHHLEAKGAGHYGIFSGRRWRDVVYPHVKSFILEHNKGSIKSAVVKPKVVAKTIVPVPKKSAPVVKAQIPVVATVAATKKPVAKPAAKKVAATKK
jgi:poly(3-hydroxybutyrate) depolymerase